MHPSIVIRDLKEEETIALTRYCSQHLLKLIQENQLEKIPFEELRNYPNARFILYRPTVKVTKRLPNRTVVTIREDKDSQYGNDHTIFLSDIGPHRNGPTIYKCNIKEEPDQFFYLLNVDPQVQLMF